MRFLFSLTLVFLIQLNGFGQSSKDHYIQALLRTNKGQYEDAIKFFNKAIELKADYSEAFLSRGNAFFKMEKFERAVWDYDKAIELDPKLLKAYNHRGYCYTEMKDYRRAIEDFTYVIGQKPDYPNVYVSRGKIYLAKKQLDEALADFNKTISLDSKFHEAYYNRGLTHLASRDTAAALSDFNSAVQMEGGNPDYLLDRARLLWATGLYKDANKGLSAAGKSAPEHSGIIVQKAKFLLEAGKTKPACKLLAKAVALADKEALTLQAEHCETDDKDDETEPEDTGKVKKKKEGKDDSDK
jgi:tetratricopeptide (TPR) repeat protein